MKLFFRLSFFSACLVFLLITTSSFAAVIAPKPSASPIKPSHPMASETWYGTSSNASKFTPSNLTPISSINKMTWYTAYINYHNSEYPSLSSARKVTADSSGNLYICWVNDADELNLSTNGSGEWVVEKIVDDVQSCAHISVDSSGNIHMIHNYTSNPDYYRHITGVSNSWTITNLGEVADAMYTRFAIDSSGFVHMSYLNEVDSLTLILKYATNTSGSLVSETVDSSVSTTIYHCEGTLVEIVVDASNNPHLTYLSGVYYIKYAAKTGGTWTNEYLDTTVDTCSHVSIAVDSKNYSHIVYTELNTEDNPVPTYATNKNGSWKKRSLEMQLMPWEYAKYDDFYNFSIALDSQENVHVSYRYEPMDNTERVTVLKYATNKGGAFKSYTVADYYSHLFTKIIVTSSAASKVTTTKPILSSATSKTMTSLKTTPILPTVVDQKVAIVTNDYKDTDDDVARYDIIYASTKEIEDTCQDFTLASTDADCDGIDDSEDTDQVDSDGDGTVDSADPDYLDSDNDGTVDSQDAFPNDPTENKDSDSDGIGDNAEADNDNDGTLDADDAFPEDATETTDTDKDKIGNNADTDDDGDGFTDDVDPNPTTFDPDTDHDGIPNCTDDDDDGDGVPDSTDADSGEA